jgi:hypothetical protein
MVASTTENGGWAEEKVESKKGKVKSKSKKEKGKARSTKRTSRKS